MEEKLNFLEKMSEVIESNSKNIKEAVKKGKEEETLEWKDTIVELFSFGNYTLITYIKGSNQEWNVALHYDRESKSWCAGNYAYCLKDALKICIEKM